MGEEPIYVPRKFRSDNYHAKSTAELNSVIKFEQQRFLSECEIIKLRLEHTEKELNSIDKTFETLIDEFILNEHTKKIALDEWNYCVEFDVSRLEEKWSKKRESAENAFQTDKDFIRHPRPEIYTETPYTSAEDEQRSNKSTCLKNDQRQNSPHRNKYTLKSSTSREDH